MFVPSEWVALTGAAENDRAFQSNLVDWLALKLGTPGYVLSRELQEHTYVFDTCPLGWTVGQVLRRLGSQLLEVTIGNTAPEVLQ